MGVCGLVVWGALVAGKCRRDSSVCYYYYDDDYCCSTWYCAVPATVLSMEDSSVPAGRSSAVARGTRGVSSARGSGRSLRPGLLGPRHVPERRRRRRRSGPLVQ